MRATKTPKHCTYCGDPNPSRRNERIGYDVCVNCIDHEDCETCLDPKCPSEACRDQRHTYIYTIDLNERGLFQAHVSDCNDKIVWEYSHDPDAENPELDLVTDGFMKHVEDVDGLEKYLKSIGILPENAVLRTE